MGWVFLTVGIIINVTSMVVIRYGQSLQKKSFTVLGYMIYLVSTFTITFSFQYLDISLAYAFWSGLGTMLALCSGVLLFKEKLSPCKLLFFSLLIIGVTGMSLST